MFQCVAVCVCVCVLQDGRGTAEALIRPRLQESLYRKTASKIHLLSKNRFHLIFEQDIKHNILRSTLCVGFFWGGLFMFKAKEDQPSFLLLRDSRKNDSG